ncbi:MAG: heavy metal translocating P-type ATPase [Oscillospiraceae bacterium]|nr:heavy metal translocating P-type ATPase [Oscillospiraceae bacterium]
MEHYQVTGMSCAACSARVEKAVSAVPGVSSCAVSLLTNSMSVEGSAEPTAVIAAVEAAGYGASVRGEAGTQAADRDEKALEDRETPRLRRRLIASVGFLLLLMVLSMGHTMWGWPLPGFLERDPVAIGIAQLLLAAIVMVINQRFFISGFRAVLHRAPNMDTLVAMGSAAAFGYSVYALFAMSAARQAGGDAAHWLHEFYFESAAMIVTLITVGKMLEARAKGKTTDALKGLMKLAPETATVLRAGVETVVPVKEIRKGDIFLVHPGERIPVDGVILEGSSAVDESALTGESIPVDKAPGAAVSAATVNRNGYLRCEATRVGEDTTLSQIIRMVSDAAATKAPIAKVADRVSGIFVPTVIGIALVTTVVWLLLGRDVGFALGRGISVLVISCPCALGLATPVAIMVGSGVGARQGVLFKTAASLEAAGRIETVALDKTGTVTEGRPRVTDLLPAEGVSEESFLRLAAALESKSEHPLARAVMELAAERRIEAAEAVDFTALPGQGLSAVLGGRRLLGGSLDFISRQTSVPPAARKAAEALAAQGKTPLCFAEDGVYRGCIAVADTIKPESPAAIRELKNMGVKVVLLTGDNERTARAIGEQAGVDEVIAGVLPDGKESVIRRLAAEGKTAMVGDGINDAPALTRADLGVAIGAGTDVAIDAADVVLVNSRLSDVPAAIRLGRGVLRNIHENLFWAFFYNSIGIPIAAGVFSGLGLTLSPMLGAAAMSLSSFCVVSNALRLNLLRIHDPSRDHKRNRQTKTKDHKEEKPMTKTMKIEGMMCPHCEARVKKALEALPGVESAAVSHNAGTAIVTLTAPVENETLKAAVEAQDYEVKGIE